MIELVFETHSTTEDNEAGRATGWLPGLHDWRLRECDYGELNGMPAAEMHARRRDHLDVPYPRGRAGGRRSPASGGS